MKLPRSKVQQFLLLAFLPVLCSAIIGFLFYGNHIFYTEYPAFQFLWSAIVASVFYYLLVYLRPRDAYLGLIILLMLTFVTTQSTRAVYVLRDIFYVAAIGAAVLFFFHNITKRGQQFNCLNALTFSGTYAVATIIGGSLDLLIIRTMGLESFNESIATAASTSGFYGVTIGLAVGAGIAIGANIFPTAEEQSAEAVVKEE